ncbi:ParA family protein [Elizabethkingia ursingii]
MSKFILITHQKGGVGKSTITYNLACALNEKKAQVAICDLDLQGTLSELKKISKVPIYLGEKELKQLQTSEYDFILIDTPPYLNNSISQILQFTDLVIVPTKVGIADFMAISKTIEIVENAGMKNKLMVVMNMVKPKTTLTTEMWESLNKIDVLVARSTLSDLVSFTRSFATNGLDDEKAKHQIDTLLIEILKKLI